MEAFAQFASDLDASTQQLLARGERLTILLKQPQYSPLTVEEQVVVIFAGTKGFLDEVPVNQVEAYEARLLENVRANGKEILDALAKEKKISDDLETQLKSFIGDFTKGFIGAKEAA